MKKEKRRSIFYAMLAFFSWIGGGCSPLGKPVDETISKDYYYNKTNDGVIYSPAGNWFELEKTDMDVDIATFRVISRTFAKDKDRAYFMAAPINIPGLDLETFYSNNEVWMYEMAMDSNRVYVFHRFERENVKIIKGADPKSYAPIDNVWGWAKDDAHYFYKHEPVEVDYAFFELMNDCFASDSAKAYYFADGKFYSFEPDIPTLKKLDKDYIYDKDNIYFYSWYSNGELIDSLFTIPYPAMEQVSKLSEEYLKVSDRLYYDGRPVEGADAATFEVVGGGYAKDKDKVYYTLMHMPEADAGTFHFSEETRHYQDKTQKYLQGKPKEEKEDN